MTSSVAPNQALRIGIVDDHPYLREGIRAILQGRSDMVVVGEAANAEAAFQLVETTPLDILLLDIEMPGKNGIRVAHELRQRGSEVKVIVFSAYDKPQYILNARRAGARAYVVKTAGNLVSVIQAVGAGLSLIQHPEDLGSAPWDVLTPMQLKVAKCVARGYADKDTARELDSFPRTIETHRRDIRKRLAALQPPLNGDPIPLARWLSDWGELD